MLHVQKKVYARGAGGGVAWLEERVNAQGDRRESASVFAWCPLGFKTRRRVRTANPPSRRYGRCRLEEREEISRGLSAGLSIREIARRLGRAASTVSREIRRNGGKCSYRAANADARAWRSACRPQPCLLARRRRLRDWVAEHLARNWSPRQIAVGLRQTFPHDASMRVSHETIYRSLFIQARNVLKKELLGHLRRGGFMRRPRAQARSAAGQIVDAHPDPPASCRGRRSRRPRPLGR